jgi:hypothetical protein
VTNLLIKHLRVLSFYRSDWLKLLVPDCRNRWPSGTISDRGTMMLVTTGSPTQCGPRLDPITRRVCHQVVRAANYIGSLGFMSTVYPVGGPWVERKNQSQDSCWSSVSTLARGQSWSVFAGISDRV